MITMLFTKRQESELITAIKGRGEIPLKFAYLGDGAKNWDKIAHHRTDSGGINSVEGKLLADKATSFISAFGETPKINVIDIGCGNGLPTFEKRIFHFVMYRLILVMSFWILQSKRYKKNLMWKLKSIS